MGKKVSELLAIAADLPRHEAERMLLTATDKGRSWLVGDPEADDRSAVRELAALLSRGAAVELADRLREQPDLLG